MPSTSTLIKCPNSGDGRDIDHVLTLVDAQSHRDFYESITFVDEDKHQTNPYIRFRKLSWAYHLAMGEGISDDQYQHLVSQINDNLRAVDGTWFKTTPFTLEPALGAAAGGGCKVWLKDETGQVSGCFKARHVMGIATHLAATELGRGHLIQTEDRTTLALASCGNAAIAASTLAAAVHRDIAVFIPPDVEPEVTNRLQRLNAKIQTCHRAQDDPPGDPCYTAFLAAVDQGAVPFCCQGCDSGLTIDGGQTLAWEMVAGLLESNTTLDRLFVQVGGGALASACFQGFRTAHAVGLLDHMPKVHLVQTEGCAPLRRAYDRVVEVAVGFAGIERGDIESTAAVLARPEHRGAVERALAHASTHRSSFMWAWEDEPHSVAHGILDDETYDWLADVQGMLQTGGYPIIVNDKIVLEAHGLGHSLGKPVCHTGASGLAGLLSLQRAGGIAHGETAAVIFSGIDRTLEQNRKNTLGSLRISWAPESETRLAIDFRKLSSNFDIDYLCEFNLTKGAQGEEAHKNWIPKEEVTRHLQGLKEGRTHVWGAFHDMRLVGFCSYSVLFPRNWWSEYWSQVQTDFAGTAGFIHELVVDPEYRRRGIGTNLCKAVHAGFFSLHPTCPRLYATIHAAEVGGRETFMGAGFMQIATYDDHMRDRRTMILKTNRPSVNGAGIQLASNV